MSLFTPAPWQAEKINKNEWNINAEKGDPMLGHVRWSGLAVVYGFDDHDKGPLVAENNARLIAAAPELVNALGNAVSVLAALRGHIKRTQGKHPTDEAFLHDLASESAIRRGLEVLRPIWGNE